MEKEIKNVVFDLGRILVSLDDNRCMEAFRQAGIGRIADYVEQHRVEAFFLEAEKGLIDQHTFCEKVRAAAGSDISDEAIVLAWNQLLTGIPEEKKELVLRLRRSGLRTFMLSNTNYMHWKWCEAQFCQHGMQPSDYFEHIFLSYEMHLVKPDRKIFEQTAAQAGIDPAQTLFIDDSADNCESARAVGFQTFNDPEGTQWPGMARRKLLHENN